MFMCVLKCIVQVCGRRGCWLHLTARHRAAPRQVNHRQKYLQRVTKIFAAVRFSEELLDKEVRESVALGKMYRELQRHVNCWDRSKVPTYTSILSTPTNTYNNIMERFVRTPLDYWCFLMQFSVHLDFLSPWIWRLLLFVFVIYRKCQVSWQWKVCHMETKQKLQSFRKCTKRN